MVGFASCKPADALVLIIVYLWLISLVSVVPSCAVCLVFTNIQRPFCKFDITAHRYLRQWQPATSYSSIASKGETMSFWKLSCDCKNIITSTQPIFLPWRFGFVQFLFRFLPRRITIVARNGKGNEQTSDEGLWQRPKCQSKNVGCVEVIVFLQ